jgi:uncharacterized protein YjbJ (UPF0337 family)
VSFANKFRDKAQVLRGRIKRNIGEVTGNRRLQSEGSADKVIGNLKRKHLRPRLDDGLRTARGRL